MLLPRWTSLARSECVALLRGPAWLAVAFGLAFELVAFAQEDAALRTLGIAVAWPSVATFAVLLAASFPLVWIVGVEPARLSWESRLAPSPLLLVWGRFVGVVSAGTAALGLLVAGSITLERMTAGEWSVAATLVRFAPAFVALLAAGATAPAVAALAQGPATASVIWAVGLVCSVGPFGIGFPVPLDRLLSVGEPAPLTDVGTLAACALATLAGLTCSVSVTTPGRWVRRNLSCASASSATSTATSKH